MGGCRHCPGPALRRRRASPLPLCLRRLLRGDFGRREGLDPRGQDPLVPERIAEAAPKGRRSGRELPAGSSYGQLQFGGFGVLLYLILWIALPKSPAHTLATQIAEERYAR
jgi:hypothetical protein